MNLFPLDKEISTKGRYHAGWDNPDGSQGQRMFAVPIHRLNLRGEWIERDDAVREPLRFLLDGNDLQIGITSLLVQSAGGAVRNLASPDLSSPRVSSAGVAFADIYPGVDWLYSLRPRGLKASIIIKSLPSLPGGFTPKWVGFAGTVANLGGLTLARPIVVDADGNEGPCVVRWTSPDFLLGVDVAWLYAAKLPVMLDPTITTEGNDCVLYTQTGGPIWTRRYFKLPTKFDISSIPDDANISAATLNLYCTGKGTREVAVHFKRFQSQTWVETDTYATLNAIGMGADLDYRTTTSMSANAFNAFVVWKGDNSDGIEADVSGGNQYFSPILHWADGSPGGTTGTENLNPNNFGYKSVSSDLWTYFTSAEGGSNLPYLDATYTLPAAAKGFGVMV